MKKSALYLIGTLAACPLPAAAIDSLALEVGHSRDVDLVRANVTWQWDRKWFADGHWHLTGYWEGRLGYWEGSTPTGETLWDVGFAPVFRLRPNASGGVQPYVEASVGAHLLSRTKTDASRDLSTAFQFAEHLGMGVTFGEKTRYDLSYRLQHLSNADIKLPNWGVTFHQVRLSYLF